jgi:hypothetical protein
MAVPASAGVNDPEIIIYRFPGVLDSGSAINVGVATVFHCTNFSGVVENMRFVTRRNGGAIATNQTVLIGHLQTITASTHENSPYTTDKDLGTGAVFQGTTAIAGRGDSCA